ncbi:MAG: hypothetical protein J6Z40_03355 [Oscillospiraceae bacterium]|nr:hypothetical protein [Oscillospiraceae bacterium]
MTFASLPMILYVLPLFVILTAIVPAQWKACVLALGGLAAVWMTGGFPALILLLISVSATWLIIRLQPKKSDTHHHRAELWLYAGIGIQAVLLLLGRLMLDDLALVPLVMCAMQGAECMSDHANNRFHKPALFSFFCYQCDMTRLPAGPVLRYETAEQLRAARQVTAHRVGEGASGCIRGLFQLVCLALPMFRMQDALKTGTVLHSSADAVFAALSFYFSLYYGMKGTAQIGQGLALMLGYRYPDSFDSPVLADSLHDFRRRFLTPLYDWTERVLYLENGVTDAGAYFARMSLVLGGLGIIFGRGGAGLLWGVLAAVLLTAEHVRRGKKRYTLPTGARRVLVGATVLFGVGLLRGRSIIECFAFYAALLGINGIMLSDTAAYLMRENWLILLLCSAGMFPLRKLLHRLPTGKPLRFVRTAVKGAAELLMLLWAYSELLSRYLRS